MSEFTPAQLDAIQAEIKKVVTPGLPFRFIGNQVVTDKDWDFRSKLMRKKKPVATDTLEVLVFS